MKRCLVLRRWSEVVKQKRQKEPEQLNKPLREDGKESLRASTRTQRSSLHSGATEGKLKRQEMAGGQDDVYLKRPEWQKYQVLTRISGWEGGRRKYIKNK